MNRMKRIAVLSVACLALTGLNAHSAASPLPLTGVNLSGGEWNIKPSKGTNYFYPTKAEIVYFAGQGMNCFRYPFRWESLQPVPRAPLFKPALDQLKESVRFATAKKLTVILDPHNSALWTQPCRRVGCQHRRFRRLLGEARGGVQG